MVKRGVKLSRIKAHFNASQDQIYKEYERGGGKNAYDPIKAHVLACQTRSNDLRIFTEEEKEKIKKLLEEGNCLFHIRKEIGCGYEPLKRVVTEEFPELWDKRDWSIKAIIRKIEALEEQIKLIYELMEMK